MCQKISKYYFHGCRSNLRQVIKFKTWSQLLIVNAFNCVFVYAWNCTELSVMKRFLRKISVDKLSVLWYKVEVLIFYQLLDHDLAFKISDEIRVDCVGHYCTSDSIKKCIVCKKNCRKLCCKCK